MYYFNMNDNTWKNRYSEDQIKLLLNDQFESFWSADPGIQRECLEEILKAANIPMAVIISGLRRVGKSTLLAQIAHQLGKDTFYYINFEDDRYFGFQADDASDLFEILVKNFGERRIFIIDEIQNVPGWELFVRRFIDQGYKFYITGSNASLLSQELGTRMTGRYLPFELFPFSFKEYLQFRGLPVPDLARMRPVDRANLDHILDQFLTSGGIPIELKLPELHFLRTLYNDVLYRDIVSRYNLEAVPALRELSMLLLSNPANTVSYNKLKEHLKLKSVNTVKAYFSYLENSWLIFTVNVYDYSLKRQQIAAKKTYCIDNGFAREVGFGFSPNTGRLLENLVFLQLRRKTKEIYYISLSSGEEVDFYLPESQQMIQVCKQMNSKETRERELRALQKSCEIYPVKKCLVLTNRNEDPFHFNEVPVEIRSVAEWLLSPDA